MERNEPGDPDRLKRMAENVSEQLDRVQEALAGLKEKDHATEREMLEAARQRNTSNQNRIVTLSVAAVGLSLAVAQQAEGDSLPGGLRWGVICMMLAAGLVMWCQAVELYFLGVKGTHTSTLEKLEIQDRNEREVMLFMVYPTLASYFMFALGTIFFGAFVFQMLS